MPYEYEELQKRQIRVLKLLPSSDNNFRNVNLQDAKIECELEIVSLDQKPKPEFEALSYYWGLPGDPSVPVLLSGCDILVAQNLKNALLNIRKKDVEVWIWADGICINQKNPKEKEIQVPLMWDIYETAKVVTVFLGSSLDESRSLIEDIKQIGSMAVEAGIRSLNYEERMDLLNNKIMAWSYPNWLSWLLGARGQIHENHPIDSHLSSDVKRTIFQAADEAAQYFPWEAYNNFTKYEYWKRVWVFQEFCITSQCRILFGRNEIDFETFALAHILLIVMSGRTLSRLAEENVELGLKVSKRKKVNEDDQGSQTMSTDATSSLGAVIERNDHEVLDSESWDPQINVNMNLIQVISTLENDRITSMIAARKEYQSQTGNWTLMRLLQRCYVIGSSPCNREATFARDKIYGLLGLASDRVDLDIEPKYENPKDEIETASIFTDVTNRLLQRGHVDILAWSQHPKSNTHLPSWVPDFEAITEPCSQTKADEIFSTSGDSELVWKKLSEERFSIGGTIVDEIRGLGQPWTPYSIVINKKLDLGEGLENWTPPSTADELFINNQLDLYLKSISAFSNFARTDYRGSVRITPAQWEEAEWRVPCGDQLWLDGTRKRASRSGYQGHKDLQKELRYFLSIQTHKTRQRQNLPPLIPDVPIDRQVEEYPALLEIEERKQYRRAMNRQYNRIPFLSQKSYLGLAPTHAEVGDLVVILFGAVQPFVLRRRGKQYELVGEAYVYGIMDGEFLKTNHLKGEFELV